MLMDILNAGERVKVKLDNSEELEGVLCDMYKNTFSLKLHDGSYDEKKYSGLIYFDAVVSHKVVSS